MSAVVRVESGGDQLALHDNTSRRSFAPDGPEEAAAWANQLIALGHSVDVGLSQINSANLPGLRLSVEAAFEPCTNLRAGATILGGDYAAASQRFGPGQRALRHALCAYNTGSFFAGQGYVNAILAAAGLSPEYADAPPATLEVASRSSLVVYGSKPVRTLRRAAPAGVEVILGRP